MCLSENYSYLNWRRVYQRTSYLNWRHVYQRTSYLNWRHVYQRTSYLNWRHVYQRTTVTLIEDMFIRELNSISRFFEDMFIRKLNSISRFVHVVQDSYHCQFFSLSVKCLEQFNIFEKQNCKRVCVNDEWKCLLL
jgi:hypothetical protein